MTEKQIAILEVALRLFSSRGFDAVPTSLIAKEAGVSEGLIFRHFKNKAGLLEAVMQMGTDKVAEALETIAVLETPEEKVTAIMEMPFHLEEEDFPFWRLVYAMKWQNDSYDEEASLPLKNLLVEALSEMKYLEPEAEADLIMSYLDGFVTTILLKGHIVDRNKLLQTLRKKYK
ncbi:MAG: TetR/AcrR family transcriptional regulator [Bacteroidia bacterium]